MGIRAGSPEVWLFFVREKKVKPPVVHGQQIKCKLEKDNAGNVDCPNCDVRLKLDANEIAAAKLILLLLASLFGCTKSAPKCSDENTVKLVKKTLNGTLPNMQVDIDTIRTLGHDNKTGAYSCGAEVQMSSETLKNSPHWKTIAPAFRKTIEYVSGVTDKGEHYVNVNFVQ